ncbi:hypothetical protein VTK26DRAFT_5033 [Humicola hyalothermophila]
MSDASEESDHIGHFVQEDDHDESEESASDSDRRGSAFFDLEADESDAELDESNSDSVGYDDSGSDMLELEFFPQFKRLPFELRRQIWEFFCPDLTAKSRVLEFQLLRQYGANDNPSRIMIWEGPFIEQQTRAARIMTAVHQESRQLVLEAFPDLLAIPQSKQLIRFNAKSDIVFLRDFDRVLGHEGKFPRIPGFCEHIHQLAIESTGLNEERGPLFTRALSAFERLQRVYYATVPADHKPAHLRWCASPLARRYFFITSEERSGLGEDADHLFCWPDVEKHQSFTEDEIPLGGMGQDLAKVGVNVKAVQSSGLEIWPMVEFLWESGIRRFDSLLMWDGEGDIDWSSSGEVYPDPDTDTGYDSEGWIVDSSISESASETEDDLVVLDDADDDGSNEDDSEPGSGDGSSEASAPSLAGHRDFPIDLTDDNDHAGIPTFSSPERSSPVDHSDESVSEVEDAAPRAHRLKRPRARVVGSDSDEDSEGNPRPKRARTEARRNLVVLSDDDEEDEQSKMQSNYRARAVLPKNEDEDDEGDNGEGEKPRKKAGPSKSLSLAEKLQIHREEVPRTRPRGDASEIEQMSGDDYDARDYADFQDDEEGNEIEDSDDYDENGLIMDDLDADADGYEEDAY